LADYWFAPRKNVIPRFVEEKFFELLNFDIRQPYFLELSRLFLRIQTTGLTRFPLFTCVPNLTAHSTLFLDINAHDEIICTQDRILQMKLESQQPTVSHARFFDPSYVLSFPPSDMFPFQIDPDVRDHELPLFQVMKANHRETRQIYCFKLLVAKETNQEFVKECELCRFGLKNDNHYLNYILANVFRN
jgi:hypothetical protein